MCSPEKRMWLCILRIPIERFSTGVDSPQSSLTVEYLKQIKNL